MTAETEDPFRGKTEPHKIGQLIAANDATHFHPHLLVVDDDPEVRDALCEVLLEEGYRVTSAIHGADALAQLASFRPDLILLDLTMPVLDGYGFLAARAAIPELARIPVVVVSATIDDRVRKADVLLVRKPIDLDLLLTQIRGSLERTRDRAG